MNFSEALELLKQRKYVTRPSMEAAGEFCVLFPDMPFIWQIKPMPNPNAGVWFGKVEDLDATDWVEFVGKQESLTEVVADDDEVVQS